MRVLLFLFIARLWITYGRDANDIDLSFYPGLKFDLEDQESGFEGGGDSESGEDNFPLHFAYPHRRWPVQRQHILRDFRVRLNKHYLQQQQQRKDDQLEYLQNIPDISEQGTRYRTKSDEDDQPMYYGRDFENLIQQYRKLEQYQNRFRDGEEAENEKKSGKSSNLLMNEKTITESYGKMILNNVKFVEDPSEFAYRPSDPLFFSNSEANVDNSKTSSSSTLLEKLPKETNKIHLNQRSSEEKLLSYKQSESPPPPALLPAHKPVFKLSSNYKNAIGHSSAPLDIVSVESVEAHSNDTTSGVYLIGIVAGISAAGTVALIAVGVGWRNLQKHVKNSSDVEYPAYGVTGPNKDISPSGDRRLAQSAQMYHYQHQKQQIIAMERSATRSDRHGSVSEVDSDEENEEGDYTVYECPGLAPTGEMEVKNPLFQDDPTPAQTSQSKNVDDRK